VDLWAGVARDLGLGSQGDIAMTDREILFQAYYDGVPVTVTHATDDEIAQLAGPVTSALDVLELWSLIAFRYGTEIEIHALGHRTYLGTTRATTRVMVVDLTTGGVRTSSGAQYALGARDQPRLDPQLRSHLGYALRTWGFDDVRPS
jgi:hypothetical protein